MQTEHIALQPVRVVGRDSKTSEGTVKIRTWDKKMRVRRAVKVWASCWGAAIVAVVLPIVHFILVPGFFLAGPIAAYFITGQSSVVLGGEGLCPECGKALPIVRSADKWPLTDLCSSCQTPVTIYKSEDSRSPYTAPET